MIVQNGIPARLISFNSETEVLETGEQGKLIEMCNGDQRSYRKSVANTLEPVLLPRARNDITSSKDEVSRKNSTREHEI